MTTTPPAEARIAGAPISWGVCEVPGRGYQLGPDRVLVHPPAPGCRRPRPRARGRTPLQDYEASGAEVLVLSAVTGAGGYDSRPVLDDDQWTVLLANLDRLATLARRRGSGR